MARAIESGRVGGRAAPPGTTSVLLVDDHQLFRDGFKELLQREPGVEICGEAGNEQEAMEHFRAAAPDLVTVDISLPAGNGIDVVKQIKQLAPGTLILVISMHEERTYAERALHAGAMGYVCKQSDNAEILKAFRTVRAGRLYLSDDMMQRMLGRAVRSREPDSVLSLNVLSDREMEVFHLIGQGHSTAQIARKLHLASTTIETYRERIKTKLTLASGQELIRQATLWAAQNR